MDADGDDDGMCRGFDRDGMQAAGEVPTFIADFPFLTNRFICKYWRLCVIKPERGCSPSMADCRIVIYFFPSKLKTRNCKKECGFSMVAESTCC